MTPEGAPFTWRIGRGDGKLGSGHGVSLRQRWGWRVPAGCRGIGLTTLSTCAPGSWASSWGSGKPVQTPQTARHCPGPCREREGPQSWAPPAPHTAALHPTQGTCSPQQYPNPKICWHQHSKGCSSHFAQHWHLWGRLAPTVPPAHPILGAPSTCSAPGRACLSAPAGRWTGIAA